VLGVVSSGAPRPPPTPRQAHRPVHPMRVGAVRTRSGASVGMGRLAGPPWIGLGKLYDGPHLGPRLLALKFIMTFEIVEKNRKSFMKFRLFVKSFGCDFSRFSELLDFSKS
jgi:hypothetical protein